MLCKTIPSNCWTPEEGTEETLQSNHLQFKYL